MRGSYFNISTVHAYMYTYSTTRSTTSVSLLVVTVAAEVDVSCRCPLVFSQVGRSGTVPKCIYYAGGGAGRAAMKWNKVHHTQCVMCNKRVMQCRHASVRHLTAAAAAAAAAATAAASSLAAAAAAVLLIACAACAACAVRVLRPCAACAACAVCAACAACCPAHRVARHPRDRPVTGRAGVRAAAH